MAQDAAYEAWWEHVDAVATKHGIDAELLQETSWIDFLDEIVEEAEQRGADNALADEALAREEQRAQEMEEMARAYGDHL